MKYLLILFFSISSCFAIDVVPVKKGETAPEDGFFVTPATMKELRQINEEKKLLQKQTVKLKDLAFINEDRVAVYQERAQKVEQRLHWEQTKGFWKGTGGFILGVLATSASVYAASKVLK